jgi:two-component system, LytTR family, response regulator LytT
VGGEAGRGAAVVSALSVLVVDDEAPARDELAFLLRQQEPVGRIAQAADAAGCVAQLAGGGFDAVFLDVRMPNADGLALARMIGQLAQPPQVVFVTAYQAHAVEAFRLAAIDYLMKPVRPRRLAITIKRLLQAREAAEPGSATAAPALDDRIAVTHRGQIRLIPVADIRVAIADGEGCTVRTASGHYHVRQALKELERRLERHGFLRVHRAHLVNLNQVSSIEGFFNGTYLLKMEGLPHLTVPVSRRHAQPLKAAIRLR